MKLFLVLALICCSVPIAHGRRIALVIGNDTYPGNKLANARNDANSIAAALSPHGYKVALYTDLDRESFLQALELFDRSIVPGDTVFLYYAGHGLQLNGENYLVPTDFAISSPADVKPQMIALTEVLQGFISHGASTQVIILDACRNNPFLADRSLKGGWAGMTSSAAGTFLAFGTAPGTTASDSSEDGHGLFTDKLLPYLQKSELDIEEMFQQVRFAVIKASDGAQVPWVASSLIGSLHVDPQLDQVSLGQAISSSGLATNITNGIHQDRSAMPMSCSAPLDLERGFVNSANSLPGPTTAVADNSDTALIIKEALQQATVSDYDGAFRTIKSALEVYPTSAIALRLAGLLAHMLGRSSDANAYFERALLQSPTDPLPLYYECMATRGEQAASICARAVGANEGLPEAQLLLTNAVAQAATR